MKPGWIIFFVALAGCGLHGGGSKPEREDRANAVASEPGARAARAAIVAPGIVEPWDGEVALAPREPGWIAEIRVTEGQRVEAGQTLAILDDAAQRAAVAAARGELAEAEAALAKLVRGATPEERRAARATAGADEARAAFARDDARRVGRLGEQQAIAAADVERAASDAAAQSALADASAARFAAIERGARVEDRAIARARVASARARLEVAEANLARRTVTAPASGTILVSRYHAGELYAGTGPLFVLGDLTRLRLRLEVDEIDAGRITVGDATSVRTDDNVQVAAGTVFRIAPRMGRRALSQENPTARADTRVREVFVELAPAPAIVPGMRLWGHAAPR